MVFQIRSQVHSRRKGPPPDDGKEFSPFVHLFIPDQFMDKGFIQEIVSAIIQPDVQDQGLYLMGVDKLKVLPAECTYRLPRLVANLVPLAIHYFSIAEVLKPEIIIRVPCPQGLPFLSHIHPMARYKSSHGVPADFPGCDRCGINFSLRVFKGQCYRLPVVRSPGQLKDVPKLKGYREDSF